MLPEFHAAELAASWGYTTSGLIPNIKENPRNRKTPKRGRKRFFNEAIHALRMRVERTFAWEDKFKRLLLRFEWSQQRHYGMKLLAYTLIDCAGSAVPKTRNQLNIFCTFSSKAIWSAWPSPSSPSVICDRAPYVAAGAAGMTRRISSSTTSTTAWPPCCN